MRETRIIEALSHMPEGADLEEAARLGYLEWLIGLPGGRSPVLAARAALEDRKGLRPLQGAPALFVTYLEQTATACVTPARRRGGRRARLH